MPPTKGRLTADDLRDATLAIVQLVQWEAFPEAVSELPSVTNCTDINKMLSEKKSRSVPNLQQFKHLKPFVLNGIMRMDGGFQNSNLPFESKHPVILPTKHPVTDILIRLYHKREGHSGTSRVLNCMRRSFWILRGRAAVRRVLHACFKCRLWSTGVGAQSMANLPEARVTAGRPPFTATGVDLMGPLNVKQGRNTLNVMWLFLPAWPRALYIWR